MSILTTPAIQKTPDVCGGDACIRDRRIPVWLIINARRLGGTDAGLLDDYPSLTQADLDTCWDYYREHPLEIERGIWFNDTAANVADGEPPPAWVLVSGRLLGLTDEEICESFEPRLPVADLAAAWVAYRGDPARIGRDRWLPCLVSVANSSASSAPALRLRCRDDRGEVRRQAASG